MSVPGGPGPALAPHAPPRHCPVCGDDLSLTRLGCPSCGTELSGSFEACDFCALGAKDRELLRIFLQSRGNMKELERHLGVSYPTARARFDALLGRLGLASAQAPGAGAGQSGHGPVPTDEERLALLERLARGEIDVDEAELAIESRAEDRQEEGV
ncbi:MAG: DUF2089 domain-containing protein [Acidimicrobiales bacterium]